MLIAFNSTGATNILGKNKKGKTSIFDALWFLFHGKDSTGRADFNARPLDANGNPIHHVDTEIDLVYEVDGMEKSIGKRLKENWVTPTGHSEKVLKGINSSYVIGEEQNIKKSDFDSYIKGLFDEERFKLLTNPLYFNSMHWEIRRKLIFTVVGEPSVFDIIMSHPKYKPLIRYAEEKLSIEQMRKRINSRISELKDEIETTEIKIKEASRNVLTECRDIEVIQQEISQLSRDADVIDKAIADKYYARDLVMNQTSELVKKKSDLQIKHANLISKERSKANELVNQVAIDKQNAVSVCSLLENNISNLKKQLEYNDKAIIAEKDRLNSLNNKYKELTTSDINSSDTMCFNCGKPYDGEKLESIISTFNNKKAEQLKNIVDQGTSCSESIKALTQKSTELLAQINTDEGKLIDAKAKVDQLDIKLKDTSLKSNASEASIMENPTPEIQSINEQIALIDMEISKLTSPNEVDVTSETEKKENIRAKLSELYKESKAYEIREDGMNRVEELKATHLKCAEDKASWELKKQLVDSLMSDKISIINNGIAAKFPGITFKMFNYLFNGEVEETCETLVNGVPYRDANNAAKINTGIKIINALSEHYDMYLPIIIDNAESVIDLEPSKSQIIRLVVEDCELTVA